MVRVLLLLGFGLFLFGQTTDKPLDPVPADRKADTYAIYSLVMAKPALSHSDNNQRYLVVGTSGVQMEKDPSACVRVPAANQAAFAELMQDREQHLKPVRLEREIHISTPYVLVTAAQADEFVALRFMTLKNNKPPSDAELFRGATDLIRLGNVYFDRQQTMAAVYTSAWCGGTCGFWRWRTFLKNEKGEWTEEQWTGCYTIAADEPIWTVWTRLPLRA